jgi:hypothetical protein
VTATLSDRDEVELDDMEAEVEPDDWPFTIIPDWVIFAPVTTLARWIFTALRAFANKANGGRTSFPSQRKLADMNGLSKTQPISAAIGELERIGAVTRKLVITPRGRKTIYRTYLEPHVRRPGCEHNNPCPETQYEGPRKTSELTDDVIDDMAASLARRPGTRQKRAAPEPPETPEDQVPPDTPETPETQVLPDLPETPAAPEVDVSRRAASPGNVSTAPAAPWSAQVPQWPEADTGSPPAWWWPPEPDGSPPAAGSPPDRPESGIADAT